MALEYDALRNTLEHHHDVPKRDLNIIVRQLIPMAQGDVITTLPVTVPAGGTMGVKMVDVPLSYPANQRIVLDLQTGHDLIFTLRHIIAASIYQWHVGPGNPKVASA